MISFLFFCENRPKLESSSSGDLFPHVFLFPERSEKPLVYRAAAGAPFHPVRLAERTWPPPTVNGRLHTMQRPVSPVSRPPV